MTDFHPALSVGVEEDLLPLSALLHQHGVTHRIFEENGQQVLAVQRAAQVPQVLSLYRAWRAGELSAIRIGPSGMSVNDVPVMELQIHPKDGKKVGLLSQLDDEEIDWIAAHLRKALNVGKRGTGVPPV